MNHKIGLVVYCYSFSLFFFLSLFFIFFKYYNHRDSKSSSSNRKNLFQYIESNPLQNENEFGVAILSKSFLDEEYTEYKNIVSGNQVIISKLGNENFECEGSCFCLSNQKRRSTPSVLSRGLSLIFSAFSTSMAFKIAEETFRENCVHHFSSICEPNNIISEVSRCSKRTHHELQETDNPPEIDVERILEEMTRSREQIEEVEEFREYRCSGSCSNRDSEKKSKNMIKCGELKLIKEMNFEKLFMNGMKIHDQYELRVESSLNYDVFGSVIYEVKEKFLRDHMLQFCTHNSGDLCTAEEENISCERVDHVDQETIFSEGLRHLRLRLDQIYEKGGGPFRIFFRDLYFMKGKMDEWRDRLCVKIIDVTVGAEYRGLGFFQRMLDEIEDWGSLNYVRNVVCGEVINVNLEEHLKRVKYEKVGDEELEELGFSGICYYKRI